jgi:hypothetical protein
VVKVKLKILTLFLLFLPGCLAYSNSEIGLGFADLMSLFKTGYVEGIMGSWTLAPCWNGFKHRLAADINYGNRR